MEEQPKSIWKKSLRLPQLFLVWLGLMVATMLIFVMIMLVINEPFTQSHEVLGLLVFGAVSATILLACWLFVRWLCCWRNLKRMLFALACLATLIALFYVEENWRGKRAWDNFRREWEAKGEKFAFKDFVPPPVPDEQNFALTPVVVSCYGQLLTRDGKRIPFEQRDTNLVNRLSFDLGDQDLATNGLGNWFRGTISDLSFQQAKYRELAAKTNLFSVPPQPTPPAADVLLALSKFDGTVEELRQASLLPYSRFPLNYDIDCPAAILLPSLAAMKNSAHLLRLRAIAELQNSQSEKALADVVLGLHLTAADRSEPFLISHLVRVAMADLMLQPIYEGLANHQWTDAQLVTLEAELKLLDFLADYQFAIRGEIVLHTGVLEYLRHNPEKILDLSSDFNNHSSDKLSTLARGVWWLIPNGWFYQNQMRTCRFLVQNDLPASAPEQHQVFPFAVQQAATALEQEFKSKTPYNLLERMFLPALANAVKKFAHRQSAIDLARTAIALERYRLARGEFPETLAVLEPQFIAQLPHDVIGGGPLKYRREANGAFTLYSIGWNERDDGGVVVFKKGSTPDLDVTQGDWVWRYPVRN
jgi:hypothetical protein